MNKNVEFQRLKDEELVNIIVKTKNVLIFDILYKRYDLIIYNKILGFGIPKNKSKDVATSFFLKLFSELSFFNVDSKFSNWMYFRLYQQCIAFVNSDVNSLRAIKYIDIDKTHLRIEVNDAILYQMNPLKLKKIMSFIEPEEKAILLMHYQDDITIEELQALYKINKIEFKEKLRKAKVRIVEIYNDL